MADIKVKDIAKKGVKTINKAVVQTERFKDNIVRTKEKAEETVSNDINSNEYASNKIKFATDRAFDESVNQFNKQGQKSFMKTKENYQKSKAKIKQLKKKKIKKLLLIATGALMNSTSSQQGESIPGIAHAVSIEL